MISLNSNTTLSTLNTATSVDMEHNKQKKKKVLFYQSKRERERERESERESERELQRFQNDTEKLYKENKIKTELSQILNDRTVCKKR